MKRTVKNRFFRRSLAAGVAALSSCFFAGAAQAEWGLSGAHGNPVYANVGINFTYFSKPIAFEIGVGSTGGQDTKSDKSVAIGGDLDLKFLFGDKWSPYLEGGATYGLGTGVGANGGASFGTGNVFVGGGLFYFGSKIYLYLGTDYVLTPKAFSGVVVGLGVKF